MLLLSAWVAGAAEVVDIETGEFVVRESGWAPLEVRKLVIPDPIASVKGECVVTLQLPLEGGMRVKEGPCPEGALEASMAAARRWDLIVMDRDYDGQPAGFRARFKFDEEREVTLLMDERWLESEIATLPGPVRTWSMQNIRQGAPKYPKSLIGTGEEAVCTGSVEISEKGKVEQIFLDEDADCGPLFVEATLKALKKWRWESPRANGKPVPATTRVKLKFQPQY